MSQFDKIIDREGTRALKLEYRERVFGNKDVLPMWVADMDFATPPAVLKAIKERVEHPAFGYTNRPEPFFESIQAWLLKRFNWKVDKSWIEFSPGVVPNLGLAVQAFTAEGDGVVVQPPVYPPFFGVVKDFNRRVIENPLVETEQGYVIDYDNLEKVTSDDSVKLLLLCHPHNPVGRVWTPEELIKMGNICKRNNVIIISDEIHCDLTLFGHKHIPLATLSPDLADITITCMAPSKTFNLAGFSTSYMISSNAKLLNAVRGQIMGHHLHMGNTFGAIALEAAYNQSEDWLEELKTYLEGNVLLVINTIKEHLPEVKMRKPEATYLLWIDFRAWGLKQAELRKFMIDKAGLGLNDGITFGKEGEGFMRMNIACPRSVVQKAMDKLVAARCG